MVLYSGDSADHVWRKAALGLIARRGTHSIASRNGPTVEITHAALEITDPRRRWVLSRTPAINIALVIAEIVHLLAGRDDVPFLSHWFSGYHTFVKSRSRAAGAYGARLRHRFGFDQLERAAHALTKNASSRQVALCIWNPIDDLPTRAGRARSGDVPCNVTSCLRVVDERLHWLQTTRSNDVFRGLPVNLAQFTCLQEVMAGWIGVDVGRYSHTISSMHAYSDTLDTFAVTERPRRMGRPNDIRLPFRESKKAWHELDVRARELVHRPTRSQPGLVPSRLASGLGPLAALYWILAAEDSRRRGWHEEMREAAWRCTDAALTVAWQKWLRRVLKPGSRDSPNRAGFISSAAAATGRSSP